MIKKSQTEIKFELFLKGMFFFIFVTWFIMVIFPMIWLFYSSFKTNAELYLSAWGLPKGFEWDNYFRAFSEVNLGICFLNSLLYSGVSVSIATLLSLMAAYILAKFKFKGGRLLYYIFMFGVFIPTASCVIPTFSFFRRLGLIDTRFGITLLYTAWNIPFAVFVLFGFVKTIPTELIDAGIIDGCSEFQVFWRIVLPLSKPGLVAVSIFNFIWVWNELLFALVLLSKNTLMSLPLGVAALKKATYFTGDWASVFAGASVVILPLIVGYIIFHRQIIQGTTVGALKG